MKLINEDRTDLSLEAMVVVAAVMNMVYGAEIAGFDKIGAKGTLVQEKKRALNAARRHCQGMITQLEMAFDVSFDKLVYREGAEYAGQRDQEFHALAAEILELVLVFLSISEGMEHDKRRNIFKMMRNFKTPSPVDLVELLKYFKFKE